MDSRVIEILEKNLVESFSSCEVLLADASSFLRGRGRDLSEMGRINVAQLPAHVHGQFSHQQQT